MSGWFKKYSNLLRLYKHYYMRSLFITNYPVEAYIEPTASCSLHCPACPTGLRLPDRHLGTLSSENFKKLIDEFGDYLFNLYMYNWGEPTLHPDFPEMIKYASDKGIRVFSSTNLNVKMSDEYIERFIKSGLYSLTVSIDGLTQETYSKYRVGGNLEIALLNLKKLHQAKTKYNTKKPKIFWQFLVFEHNEHEVERLKEVYKSLGADYLYITSPVLPKNLVVKPSTNPLYLPQTQLKPTPSKTCSQLYGCLIYNPSGHISPCCSIPYTTFDYAIYNGNVKEAMNSEKFVKAREFFKKGGQPYFDVTQVDGMALGLKQCEFVCSQCPASGLQDGLFYNVNLILQIKNRMIFHIFNYLKTHLSISRVNYLRNKWDHWQRMSL